MSTKTATAEAVATLFTAAGRNYAEVEMRLYHSVLTNITDDVLAEAVAAIVRDIDLGERFPSPAVVLGSCRDVLRRRQLDTPAIPESTEPLLPPAENTRRMRELRESIRAMKKETA